MKNNLIKSILLIYVLVLVFATSALTISASEPTVAVSSSDFLTRQGENFTTTIYIPDNANIVDFDITLNYDMDILSLVQIEEHEDIKGTVVFNAENPGVISINYTRTSKNVTSYLPIVNLTFVVDENAGIGQYECLTVDYNETYIAHTLNSSGTLDSVDFLCDFSKLVIYEMGDVDLSGSLNIADATYIRRHLAEIQGAILEGFKLSLADTYYDGLVNIADAVSLQRYLAHLNVLYGDRINVNFVDINGESYAKKSVVYDGTLLNIPAVPVVDGYSDGVWSQSSTEYIAPNYNNLQSDITLYAFYEGGKTSAAVEYYKRMLTDQYYSGDMVTNLSSDLSLWSTLYYQDGYYANLIWSSDCSYILNSTTGKFTKPTYPQDMTLTAKIISYDSNNKIEAEDSISFNYNVPGEFITPTKKEVESWIKHYFTDSTDNKYRVNYDVKLVNKLNNTVIPTEGSFYDNFEIRIAWYQNVDGREVPISHIERTTTSQTNDYIAVATFNGKPLDGDGKIYVDDVEVTAIDQMEIKDYIIQQIAANMGTLVTDGISLWNNDNIYGTTITWETGNSDIAYVSNNVVKLKDDAITGSTLPLNARVSYAVDGGEAEEFVLSYNLTVSCDNTIIKAPENMDPELYKAIKTELEEELGYRGNLTSAALANVKFVNLDLSDYPDITSLRGLSYCTHLRTLNISGLHITDGTMNQIATLSYLEAFIARDCDLDNLSDGGTTTLRNAVNLKMIDLTNNNFTSLDSVFAEGIKYGNLREVYLSNNQLTDINALQRAPMVTYLSLSNNGLTTEGTAAIANYPYLQYLSLSNNNIDSVENLTGLKYLTELRMHNNKLTDVRALRSLVNLEILYLGHNQIQDVGFLNSLVALELLYVNDNKISDVSALTALSKLEIINVSNNNISSLSVLRNYVGTLTEIYAENNKLTDFSFINGASKLHILMLAGNKSDIAQSNMSTWLSGLSGLEVLTLSDIALTDLYFLDSMDKLARLDVANCGLSAYAGEISNIEQIANCYATLRVLNISNNDMRGYEDEILKLRNISLLTVLYADNICDKLDAYTLTYSMPELKYISLENCGIESANWLFKYNNLAYVDLANNNISAVSFDSDISNASIKTLEELYLDTNVPCTFTNAYRIADMNVTNLSLAGISVDKIENLPYLDNIRYLNLSNTGLTNLIGDDAELADMYSINRYSTVEVIDVSDLETDISLIETLSNVKTVYAVGAVDSKLFYEDNLHALQRMHNSGLECYLYDKQNEYTPVAVEEGTKILNLLDDISCNIIVAADNVISDNNPFIVDEINDFDITWSVSNSDNYEIVNNHLSVKDYAGIEDETLIVTASITVYPDQEIVTREFEINTNILRASTEYYDIDATGYSKQLTRDKVFNYDLDLKAVQTEGFTNPVKPVEDNITYSYSAITEGGKNIPYPNVLIVNEDNSFAIASDAPLNSTVEIKINVSHTSKNGEVVKDVEEIVVPITIVSRTFAATFVMNGGTIVDSNGISLETCDYVEDSLIFSELTYNRPGYEFAGWYMDAEFTELFSIDGKEAVMPSKDITLYAKWVALSYNVYFDANGGDVDIDTMTALSDVALGELPTPTREYYTFDGWFTDPTSGELVTSETKFARTEDIMFYAHWTKNTYTLTFDASGGNVSETSRLVSCGEAIGELPIPTKTGYDFIGWFTSEGVQIKYNTVKEIAEDITVVAEWTLLKYNISWETGTGYSVTVNRNSSPYAAANIGELKSGDTIYYGDVLDVTYQANTGYSLTSKGMTSISVTGDIDKSHIYASANVNSYTYNIVYQSVNGTRLGTSTATYNYGTTNTISPKAFNGYNTPGAQSIKWDSTSAKTITFTYGIASVSNGTKSGTICTSPTLKYSATVEYRNRTASSVQLCVRWTTTIGAYAYDAYGQKFKASVGSVSTGEVQVTAFNSWGSSSSSARSSTGTSGWITVPVNTTAKTAVTMSIYYYQTNYNNTDMTKHYGAAGLNTSWSVNIPAY